MVLDEQPMPESFASCSAAHRSSPQQASTTAAVTESWPQPAHSVDMLPSYCRRVMPSALRGSEGCATFGLLMNDMALSGRTPLPVIAERRGASGSVRTDAVHDGIAGHRKAAVAQDGFELRLVDRGLERQERAQLRVAILLDDEEQLACRLRNFSTSSLKGKALARACSRRPTPGGRARAMASRTAPSQLPMRHDPDLAVALGEDHRACGTSSVRRSPTCFIQPVEHHLVFGRSLRCRLRTGCGRIRA